MQTRSETINSFFKVFISLVGVNFAFLTAFYLSFNEVFQRDVNAQANYKFLLTTANLLCLVVNLLPARRAEKTLRNYGLFLCGYLALIIFSQGYEFSRLFHVYFLSLLLTANLFLKLSSSAELVGKFLLGEEFEKKIIVVGDDIGDSITQHLGSRPGGYTLVGFVGSRTRHANRNELYLGDISALEQILTRITIDEILVSTSFLPVEKIEEITKLAERHHATVSILPAYFQFLSKNSCHTDYWMGVPVVSVFHSRLAMRSYQIAKRALDICFSAVFLTAVFPVLFLIVAPAIWFTNKGPIFFKQLRKGHKQEPFFCYKFRTMMVAGKIDEIVQAKRQDARITRIGGTLRKTSIDEIPQFLNVLAGNMSLVGPRPHMVEHDELYKQTIERYNVRFAAKPGITGWAQVNGFRGGTEDITQMEKRIEHDLWYIKNWSVWLDIKIITMTAVTLIFKGDKNAY